jgi:phosphoglycerate dehydrogenase-like enzyme
MSEKKIKVSVVMDFSDELLERLRAVSPRLVVQRYHPSELTESIWQETEVLYTSRVFPPPEHAPMLRWIQLHIAGVEHLLKERIAKAEDIVITSASGVHTRQMAEYCLMMILAFHFQLPRMLTMQRHKEWREDRYMIFSPPDLQRQTLGIVGYGTIGREVARLAKAFGMNVLASKRDAKHPAEVGEYTPVGTGDPTGDLPERIYPSEALATMARECDYLVVLTPLTEQTRQLINATVLAAMKPSAVLINAARGGVVDEAALIQALNEGRLRGAGLDVFEQEPLPPTSPLWQMEQVLISPHVAGNSQHYHEKCIELFCENLKLYVEKKPLLNRVKREKGY